ncbi:solute carrier family 28 member 3-like [Haliotis rufescens]|uniref:solute carrier family 28 member 3-like n=1 Tax=Haliotis rufescens TaxID=6454 RepID=UPI00201E8457|nr:solute carrier family 28 member 3-like [Haliotis rufescens]
MAECQIEEEMDLVKMADTPNEALFAVQNCPKATFDSEEEDVSKNTHGEERDYMEHYLPCGEVVTRTRASVWRMIVRNKKPIGMMSSLVLLTVYIVYFGFCMRFSFGDEGSLRLMVGTVFLVFIYGKIKLEAQVQNVFRPLSKRIKKLTSLRRIIRWLLYVALVVFIVVYLTTSNLTADNFVSLAGLTFFILLGYLISEHPARVNWHAVFWGIGTQVLFALLILRTNFGYEIFRWLGDRIEEFLEHTDKGSEFVFGKSYRDHMFVFRIMPLVMMFCSTINVLYYYGILQAFVANFGWFLTFCLGTSPVESVNTALNILFGPAESPIAIKPFLPLLTPSELHAVMAAGFASIAGSVFGMLTSFGAPANHLLAASVMSAPAALAMSKLIVPETQWTKIKPRDAYNIPVPKFNNILEAVSEGARESLPILTSIIANQIIYIAIVQFVDSALIWFGNRVGVSGLSFAFLCSYCFYPLIYIMGFSRSDILKIGELLGIKTFANSFYGYHLFGKLIKNREVLENYVASTNGTWHWEGSDVILDWTNRTLPGGILTKRSEVIGTYAFCGQNHLAALGVAIGVFNTLIPQRKYTITKYIIRANITGQLACYMTACIAGMLYDETLT